MQRLSKKLTHSLIFKAVVHGGFAMALLSGCTNGVEDRITSAYELARHPNERHKNRIEALVRDPDRDVRATALVAMQGIDGERARRMASFALQDEDGLVRAAAVTVLSACADLDALRRLTALASGDPVWHVRSRALEAIAAIDEPAVHEAFARALADPVRYVRRTALRAGAGHPGLLPVGRLVELVVLDPDWENRVEAARALGASKDPAAYAGLDAAMADPNEFVRATGASELRAFQAAGIPR